MSDIVFKWRFQGSNYHKYIPILWILFIIYRSKYWQ